MRKIMRPIISVLTALTMLTAHTGNVVNATVVDEPKGLIWMSPEAIESTLGGIVGAITTNNVNALSGASAYLTTSTLYELQQFIEESSTHGTLVRMHVDRIEQSGSTDSDIVFMATAVTNLGGYEYYTLYEFHVDTVQGQIYGYNIWVY